MKLISRITSAIFSGSERNHPVLSHREREAIRAYANGHLDQKADAIAAYEAARKRGVPMQGDTAMQFMGEVTNPNPDPGFQRRMRHAVIKARSDVSVEISA